MSAGIGINPDTDCISTTAIPTIKPDSAPLKPFFNPMVSNTRLTNIEEASKVIVEKGYQEVFMENLSLNDKIQ